MSLYETKRKHNWYYMVLRTILRDGLMKQGVLYGETAQQAHHRLICSITEC